MIGNNMQEDIVPSRAVGFDTYLITDCLIDNGDGVNTSSGTFDDCITFLNNI